VLVVNNNLLTGSLDDKLGGPPGGGSLVDVVDVTMMEMSSLVRGEASCPKLCYL